MLLMLISTLAFAGYGDAVYGSPTRAERELHLWSNAVRVAPSAFVAEYTAAGCSYDSFTADEKTPQKPLRWHLGLNQVAHEHSVDMYENDWFSHQSSDGTPWNDRVRQYYPTGAIGENVAYGFSSEYRVVTRGFMCSAGHRKNLMRSIWNELGTGSYYKRYTQDFGGLAVPERSIAMGVHTPAAPTSTVTLLADYYDSSGAAPDRYVVVVDGRKYGMSLKYGSRSKGVYQKTLSTGTGCHKYYFEAVDDGVVTRFPETGAYGWGNCTDYTDKTAGWYASR